MDKRSWWLVALVGGFILFYALAGRDLIYFRTFFFALAGFILGKRLGTAGGALFVLGVLILDHDWFLRQLSYGGISLYLVSGITISYWVGSFKGTTKVHPSLSISIVLFFIFAGYVVYIESLNWPIYFLYPFLIAASALIYYFLRLLKERRLIQILFSGLILSYLLAFGLSFIIRGEVSFQSYSTTIFISLVPGDILTLTALAIIYPHLSHHLKKEGSQPMKIKL
jgi:hypothetical protein